MGSSSNSREIKLFHKWVIKDFSTQNKISSSEFSHLEDIKNTWALEIYPNQKNANIGVFLKLVSAPNEVNASYSVSLKDIEGSSIIKKGPISYIFSKESKSLGWRDFIHRVDVINKIYDHDDILLVICEVTIEENQPERKQVSCLSPFLTNLERLVNNPEYSDVILESSDGKEIHAHKAILSTMSPVFSSMFSNNMLEKNTNRVLISDIDHETLLILITFMYTSKITKAMSDSEKVNLLMAVHKYDISALSLLMDDYLILEINQDNAIDLLITSYLCNRPKLKVSVINFICTQDEDYILSLFENENLINIASKYPELLNECHKNLFLFRSKIVNVTEGK